MKHRFLWLCLAIAAPSAALSNNFDRTLEEIEDDWAFASYAIKDSDLRATAFVSLSKRTRAFVAANPQRAEPLIWNGIVESTLADTTGGLTAWRHANEARRQLEAALRIDDGALRGSAYVSLGTLYFKEPGFPIGFGSKKKAFRFLKKALELDPDGIDSNFCYAKYLLDQGESVTAQEYLQRGLQAHDRPGRPLVDRRRRTEIRSLLDKIGVDRSGGLPQPPPFLMFI